MNKFALVVAAAFIAGTAFAGAKKTPKAAEAVKAGAPAAAMAKGEGVVLPAENLKWEMPFGEKGPAFAFVVGDMKSKGQAAMFMKFPAGFDSGWHTHDGDYSATAVKGIITHQVQGGTEYKLAAGSYWTQPGKVNHRNTCVAEGGECILYGTMPAGFSFTPKTPEGKDVPKTAGTH